MALANFRKFDFSEIPCVTPEMRLGARLVTIQGLVHPWEPT